ncbi:linear amide C-N hydrolase [Streptomyces sp. A0592]|uniref:linear amide C-N hydrolase n=1 Tax=Streptomyces sp. A0592 TaxID=2563099 RepID=UPI00109EDE26|nr:linear amide C-N hydrolase [Streptomyces sp. A0592]THA86118.1 linear amide C-N hydrolase [Streptomyces sp. A0592]
MCTRILWNTGGHAVLAGRTMDWPESTEPVLTVFPPPPPRGVERDGGKLGGTDVVGDNPLLWTSRFGSIVTTVYGAGTADGLNEAGLAAHMLYLDSTDLGPRDPGRPGLQIALWIQYLLDGAATVAEALDLLDTCRMVPVGMRGFAATVHVALEDASGDSAVVEHLGGRRQVHHDRSYTVMTNEPPYDEQLRLLREQVRIVRELGHGEPVSEVPVPGNVNAVDPPSWSATSRPGSRPLPGRSEASAASCGIRHPGAARKGGVRGPVEPAAAIAPRSAPLRPTAAGQPRTRPPRAPPNQS